jgi:predicted Rossmann fold flavoprotein
VADILVTSHHAFSSKVFDVVIIGAGAAGLMCAMTAGARGARVLLLDHNTHVGAKILISGGGRCNFTNTGTSAANFLSANPHFSRSALSRFKPHDFLALVEKHKIAWHEKTLGQLFCDGSAKQIVGMLLSECASVGVVVQTGVKIIDLRKADQFHLETSAGSFAAPKLVLATGGLSIPKMGATGFAYDIARKFGLKIVACKPGLVPLHAPPAELAFYTSLSGVSVKAVASAGKITFAENVLFTHRGLSGPAILQASSYLEAGDALQLDLAPDVDVADVLKQGKHMRPKAELKTVLADLVPQRLAAALASSKVMSQVSANDMHALHTKLRQWNFVPPASEGYAKAEVTVGGIDTNDLSSKTMEAKSVTGLYAIGEAVDVTGWLGGYNFQWAWASGFVAGEAAAIL